MTAAVRSADVQPEPAQGWFRRWWVPRLATAPCWDPPAVPTLVVVPHPDDEVLGCGGLIARQCARRVTVGVVAVTDGEAAYPGIVPAAELSACRRAEQAAALGALGADIAAIRRLGLPDGEVAANEDRLSEELVDRAVGYRLIVAPWVHDQHPDHEAVGRAALRAGAVLGIEVVQTVFWGWRGPPGRLLDAGPVRFPLTETERDRRRRALSAHGSQLGTDTLLPDGTRPILGPTDLEPVAWSDEVYLRRSPR